MFFFVCFIKLIDIDFVKENNFEMLLNIIVYFERKYVIIMYWFNYLYGGEMYSMYIIWYLILFCKYKIIYGKGFFLLKRVNIILIKWNKIYCML